MDEFLTEMWGQSVIVCECREWAEDGFCEHDCYNCPVIEGAIEALGRYEQFMRQHNTSLEGIKWRIRAHPDKWEAFICDTT